MMMNHGMRIVALLFFLCFFPIVATADFLAQADLQLDTSFLQSNTVLEAQENRIDRFTGFDVTNFDSKRLLAELKKLGSFQKEHPDNVVVIIKLALVLEKMADHTGDQRQRIQLYDTALANMAKAMRLDSTYDGLQINQAIIYSKLGKLFEAQELLDKVIEFDPENMIALNNRAVVRFKLKYPSLAIDDLKAALKIKPLDPFSNGMMGEFLFARRDYAGARDYFQTAILFDKVRTSYARKLSLCHFMLKEFVQTIEYCNIMIERNQDVIQSQKLRGFSYYKMDKLPEAIAQYTELLAVQTGEIGLLQNRGVAYWKQGSYEASLGDFNKILEIAPNNNPALFNKALIYASQQKWEESEKCINAYLEESVSDSFAYLLRGMVRRNQERYEEAKSDLEDARYGMSENYELLTNLGFVNYKLGDKTGGKEYFDRLLASNNYEPQITISVVQTYGQLGEYEQAITLAESQIQKYEAMTDTHEILLRFYEKLGAVYSARGSYEIALEYFDKGLKWEKENIEFLYNKGVTLYLQQEYTQEVAILEKVVKEKPDFRRAWVMLGTSYREMGDVEKAEQTFNRAEEKMTEKHGFHDNLTNLFVITGDYKRVISEVKLFLLHQETKADDEDFLYQTIFGIVSAKMLNNQSAVDEFAQKSKERYKEKWQWQQNCIAFLTEKITEQQLLKIAKDDGEKTEANCYMAMVNLARGKQAEAKKQLDWIANHGNKLFVEYAIAVNLLKEF